MIENAKTTGKHLTFSFREFHPESINIPHVFNNHFKDEREWNRACSLFVGDVLIWLSREDDSIFTDSGKRSNIHMHPIRGKMKILATICGEYNIICDEDRLDNFYQMELIHADGAVRIVFERIGNHISFLFFDTNHHIYLNKEYTKNNNSLYYEFCPVFQQNECERMNYMHTCFAVDFLDHEKLKETYNY